MATFVFRLGLATPVDAKAKAVGEAAVHDAAEALRTVLGLAVRTVTVGVDDRRWSASGWVASVYDEGRLLEVTVETDGPFLLEFTIETDGPFL